MNRRVLLGVAIAFVAAVVIVAVARTGGVHVPEDAGQNLLPVEVISLKLIESYDVQQRFAGRVSARRSSDLGFERGGMLAEVMVDEGATVEEGATLARLDTRSLEAQLEQARAAESEAQARLALANVTVERQQQLLERKNVSQQRFDEARYERQAVSAQFAAARANVRSLEVALELATIRAPYAGSIVARMADEGTVVGAGTPIFRILETGRMEARIGVPPEMLSSLEVGGVYQIEVRGEFYPATLTDLLDQVEVDTRTVTAIFAADAPRDAVRSGELARLPLTQHVTQEGFWVPLEALTEGRRGLWSVYAIVPDDADDADTSGETVTLERRTVQLLHTESDRAFVRGTLENGDRIVSAGSHRLVPGQRVVVATTAAQAGE